MSDTGRISLVKTDPAERLEEFCSQSNRYHTSYLFSRFENGIMAECSLESPHRVICSEAQFVLSTDIEKAKRIISAILLYRLGLGVDEGEDGDSDDEPPEQDFVRVGMRAVSGILEKLMDP